MCSEDVPSEALPDYPQVSLDPAAYGRAQSTWAVQTIGIYRREKARRAATATCLADLRRAGLIN